MPRLQLAQKYAEVVGRNHEAMLEAEGERRVHAAGFREYVDLVRRYNALCWDAYEGAVQRFEALPEPKGFVDRATMNAMCRFLARVVVRDEAGRPVVVD